MTTMIYVDDDDDDNDNDGDDNGDDNGGGMMTDLQQK